MYFSAWVFPSYNSIVNSNPKDTWGHMYTYKSLGNLKNIYSPGWNGWSPLIIPILLSHFSRVRLCVTPLMAAHQAPPSRGFSRKEHWSGLPFPSPMHESEKWKVKVQSLSRVRLLAIPWTAAYQAPPSMGFSQARVLYYKEDKISPISRLVCVCVNNFNSSEEVTSKLTPNDNKEAAL